MTKRLKNRVHLSLSQKMEVFSFDLDPKESGCLDRCDYGINGVCYVGNNPRENFKPRKTKLQRNMEFLKSDKFNQIKFEILSTRLREFRWFSAGDIPDLESFKKIVQVCRECVGVKFWMPTSRDDILNQFFEVEGLAIPENLIIRLSAPIIGEKMPAFMVDLCQKWGVTWSETTLNEKEATCHASLDGLSCEMCEDCFQLKPVVYMIHGRNARARASGLKELRG